MSEKIALVTTTINVPHVLRLYRKYGPDVQFFVIGDRKTPHAEVDDLCRSIGKATYYSPELQSELGYACSKLIGWDCVQRRNIGFLEALKWGADMIVTVDDDNIPMDRAYFYRFWGLLNKPFSGLSAVAPLGEGGWFNAGELLDPPVSHRGFPLEKERTDALGAVDPYQQFTHVVDAQIGVAAGLWMGDPDISALERGQDAPLVRGISEVGRAGVATSPGTWTVFNSQNTAFRRELTPAMMMWPGVGRYDDICASLVCQRLMRERDLHTHFGQPFVYQQRNAHDWLRDLEQEMWGMQHILELADAIGLGKVVPGPSVIENLREVYRRLPAFVPSIVKECGQAWLEDCEKAMG